jgi:hypothetical protein
MTFHYKSTAEKTGQPKLPMETVYQILEQNMKPVEYYKPDSVLDSCKYIRLARKYHYINYKLIFYKDIRPWGLGGSFSTYQSQFFADAGCTIGVFNTLNSKLTSIIFRATNSKDFMNYCKTYTFYGYDLIDPNFKYGDWLVITEGIYDADVLRPLYPNVVATLTSSVTIMMAEVLKLMTNRFIIAYDSDEAGASGFDKAFQRLSRDGGIVKRLPVFLGDKDIGSMEEIEESNPSGYSTRWNYYKSTLKNIMSDSTEMLYL